MASCEPVPPSDDSTDGPRPKAASQHAQAPLEAEPHPVAPAEPGPDARDPPPAAGRRAVFFDEDPFAGHKKSKDDAWDWLRGPAVCVQCHYTLTTRVCNYAMALLARASVAEEATCPAPLPQDEAHHPGHARTYGPIVRSRARPAVQAQLDGVLLRQLKACRNGDVLVVIQLPPGLPLAPGGETAAAAWYQLLMRDPLLSRHVQRIYLFEQPMGLCQSANEVVALVADRLAGEVLSFPSPSWKCGDIGPLTLFFSLFSYPPGLSISATYPPPNCDLV